MNPPLPPYTISNEVLLHVLRQFLAHKLTGQESWEWAIKRHLNRAEALPGHSMAYMSRKRTTVSIQLAAALTASAANTVAGAVAVTILHAHLFTMPAPGEKLNQHLAAAAKMLLSGSPLAIDARTLWLFSNAPESYSDWVDPVYNFRSSGTSHIPRDLVYFQHPRPAPSVILSDDAAWFLLRQSSGPRPARMLAAADGADAWTRHFDDLYNDLPDMYRGCHPDDLRPWCARAMMWARRDESRARAAS